MDERVIVVGGGYAGVLAAIRARRRLGKGGEVVLIAGSEMLWERIRLHESVASGRDARRPIDALLRGTGVRLVASRCEGVDRAARTVTAGGETLRYDRLIVAVGSVVDRDAIPGARYLEIPDAGHLGFIEKPDQVNKAALEFLAEVDGKPFRWAPMPPAHD